MDTYDGRAAAPEIRRLFRIEDWPETCDNEDMNSMDKTLELSEPSGLGSCVQGASDASEHLSCAPRIHPKRLSELQPSAGCNRRNGEPSTGDLQGKGMQRGPWLIVDLADPAFSVMTRALRGE